jgi:methionine-rich copper-binding protein CopC
MDSARSARTLQRNLIMPSIFRQCAIAAATAALFATSTPASAQSEVRLVASHPRNDAQVAAPVERVSLAFNQVVDLTHIDIEAEDGTITVVYDVFETPDNERKANNFTDDLKQAVTAPGKYYVNYGASVTTGKTTSTVGGWITFTVTDPDALADDGANGKPD